MLQISNIKKHFRYPVLQSINLNLKEGALFVLTGKNGTGKTTLLKILASVIIPDSGTVTFDNMDIKKDHSRIKQITGFVFSNERSFYLRLSGMDNLIFFSSFYNIEKNVFLKKLQYYASELNFPERLLKQPVIEYSTGQRQLLSIIRALIHDPRFIFIDEISSSLDEDNRSRVYSIVKNEVSHNKIVIAVTSSLEEAEILSDNIGILENGILSHAKT